MAAKKSTFIKKLAIIIGIIITLLILIPFFIPLDNYKETISGQVKSFTGRELSIDGKIKLAILPYPSVKIGKIKLASIPGAQNKSFVEIEQVKVSIAIMPLLSGNIVIPSIEIEEPEINLETLSNGANSWDFIQEIANESAKSKEPETEVKTSSKTLPFNIHKIKIKDGQVSYIKVKDKIQVKDINIGLDVSSMKGPIDLELDFKAFGQKLSLEGKIKEIGDIIPIEVSLKTFGEKATLVGKIDAKNLSFTGAVAHKGKAKDIDELKKLGFKEDYSINLDLIANKNMVIINDLAFQLEDIKANAKGTYSLDDNSAKVSMILNPGEIQAKLNFNNKTTGTIRIGIKSVKSFLDALKMQTTALPPFITEQLSFSTNVTHKDKEINFDKLLINIGPSKTSGKITIKNMDNIPHLVYDVSLDGVNKLAYLLSGKPLAVKLGKARIDGDTLFSKGVLTTNTNFTAVAANIIIKGDITPSKQKLDLNINAYGNSLDNTLQQISGSNPNIVGKFNIATKLQGVLNKALDAKLYKTNIVIGKDRVDISGKTTINLDKAVPHINTTMKLSPIDLNVTPTNTNNTNYARGNNSTNNKSSTSWSQDRIDLSFLKGFEGEANVIIDKLSTGSLIVDNINAVAKLKEGTLSLNSLNGGVLGGKIAASGEVSAFSTQPISGKVILTQAQLTNMSPQGSKFKITKGTIDCNAEFNSSGTNQLSYVKNLSGKVDITGANGRLSGVDLQKAIETLNNINSLDSVFRGLKSSFSGGETNFSKFESSAIISNGIAKLTNTNLQTDGANASATGTIDLPKYYMDIDSRVDVDIKSMPSINVRLYGLLDNPKHKINKKPLEKYLVKNVLTKVLGNVKGGKAQDMLKGIIGGSDKSSAIDENGNESKKTNPVNQLMKKGLKGLFK